MRVLCPSCSAKLKATPKLFGKTVKCPKCGHAIKVPTPNEGVSQARLPPAAVPKQQKATSKQKAKPSPVSARRLPPQNPVSRAKSSVSAPAKSPSNKSLRYALMIGAIVGIGSIGGLLFFLLQPRDKDTASVPQARSEVASTATAPGSPAKPVLPEEVPPKELTPTETERENESGTSEPKEAPPRKAVVKTGPPLVYNFGIPRSRMVYDTAINYKANDEPPVEINGRLFYETLGAAAKNTAESGHFRGAQLPAIENVTGVGLPGNRVVIPSLFVQQAEKIEIEIDGSTYRAEVLEDKEDGSFAILDYIGPEFPPLRTLKVDQHSDQFLAIRLDNESTPQPIVQIEAEPVPSKYKLAALKGMPPRWRSAVLYKHWGSASGLFYKSANRNVVIRFSEIVKHFPPETFDFTVPDQFTTTDLVPGAKKNLVKVTVTRTPRNSGNEVNFQYKFDVKNGKSLRLPGHTIKASDEIQSIGIKPNGVCGLGSSLGPTDFFPPGLIALPEAAFFEVRNESTPWPGKERYFYAPVRTLKAEVVTSKRLTDRRVRKKLVDGRTLYKLLISNSVIEDDQTIAKIQRTFTVERVNLASLLNNPKLAVLDSEDNSFQFNATQLVDFDRTLGKVTQSKLTGSIGYEKFDANFDIRLQLLGDDEVNAAYAKLNYRSKWGRPLPTKKLEAETATSIANDLASGASSIRRKALDLLNTCAPEPNAEISKALANDFASRFRNVRSAWRASRNWILPQDIRTMVISYVGSKNALRTPAAELLILNPRLPEKSLPDVEELIRAGMDLNASYVLLSTKYPELAEPACIEYLDSLTSKYRKGMKAVRLLRESGSEKCVETLERFAASMKRENADFFKEVNEVVEDIKGRK